SEAWWGLAGIRVADLFTLEKQKPRLPPMPTSPAGGSPGAGAVVESCPSNATGIGKMSLSWQSGRHSGHRAHETADRGTGGIVESAGRPPPTTQPHRPLRHHRRHVLQRQPQK